MTLKLIVSQRLSVRRGLNRRKDVNRTQNGAATAAFIKHKSYSFTIIMYYLKTYAALSTVLSVLHSHYLVFGQK